MKKIIYALEMPHGKSYVGGISFIINQYIGNREKFLHYGCMVDLLDYTKGSLKIRRIPSKFLNVVNLLQQKKMLRNYLAANKDAIIHMHTSRGWIFVRDLILANFVKKKYGNKLVLSIHFAELSKILSRHRVIRNYQLSSLKTCFDKIIFLSSKTRDEFVACGIDQKKTEVVYTFHTYGNRKKPVSRDKAEIKLLFMGSIDKRKGVIDLLTALKQINGYQYQLHICGLVTDASIVKEYVRLMDELKEKVVFHGYVTGQEKEKLFENADIFVLPSYGEGMPITILEAMAKGCGIISTEVGAIKEVVGEQSGILIEPGNVEGLVNALTYFMSNMEKLHHVKEYNRTYGAQFHLADNIERLAAIYLEI